ncbi:putative major facilitator superfamily domain-containing protein [Lupinus albus]|uniref:Putative major facilitator superfamily domain-containing protein n=1 Tax=Lupinus albus TaxID=3870 RepID=A0A6A4QME0_LUPAL|nr:putative major facilitator superfamily domain-containing protein [Lupinus albus]
MSSSAFQWLSLIGMIWLQAINGTNTDFPAYSSQLKQLLSMSQMQLNNLAFASDAGKLFGFFSGIASAYLPLWLVLMIGSTLGLIGYGNSVCWIIIVCYVVTIRNFSSDSQVAIGLTTSYQGLSAKIYTNIADVISRHNQARTFLFLNSILPFIVCLITVFLVTDIGVMRSKYIDVGFVVMFVITIVTGIYDVISSLQIVTSNISPLNNLIGILVTLFLPLLVSISLKIKELVEYWKTQTERIRVYHSSAEESTREKRSDNNEVKEGEDNIEIQELGMKDEIGVKLMARRIDFWLYFFVYPFGATLGLVFLNNLGQIAESRGCSTTSSLVSLSSSFGFFGRLMSAIMDYFSRSKYAISKSASMAALMAPTAMAFFLLLNKTHIALYTSTAIIGVCTGAFTSISVSTTTELFGSQNFAVNHNVVVANIPIGSFLFGYLAALVYHKEGHEHGKCMGMDCYRKTFLVWGTLCLFGTFLALILHAKTRKVSLQEIW